jgi:Tfp pilus assembly protein PilX
MLSLKFLRNEKGFATYIALGVILVLTALGTGISVIVNNELTISERGSDRNSAYYLAEAGINNALWELNQTTPGDGVTSGSLNGGTYSTTYSGQVLTSTGTYNSVNRKIIVNTTETTAPSAFDVGVFAGSTTSINVPATANRNNVVIWNGLASTDQNKVVLENYANGGWLNVYGYILNKPEVLIPPNPSDPRPHTTLRDPERHAVAYAKRPANPVNYLGSFSEGRRGTSPSGFSPPRFYFTPDDNKIALANTFPVISRNWGTSPPPPLSGGPTYITGNLTITNNRLITTNASATASNPAEVIVWGSVTINSGTIGNATGNSYIRILANGNITFNGTNGPIYLKKETQFYSKSIIYVYNNITMDRASIFAKGTLQVNTTSNLARDPDIDLDGILFSGNLVQFVVGASGGTIQFDGGVVSGYTNDVGTVVNRSITFTTPSRSGRLIQVTASQTAKPSKLPSAFLILNETRLDYTAWREN